MDIPGERNITVPKVDAQRPLNLDIDPEIGKLRSYKALQSAANRRLANVEYVPNFIVRQERIGRRIGANCLMANSLLPWNSYPPFIVVTSCSIPRR